MSRLQQWLQVDAKLMVDLERARSQYRHSILHVHSSAASAALLAFPGAPNDDAF
jgi:hypothetical protein